jgi:CheY-like chemotaxis protein
MASKSLGLSTVIVVDDDPVHLELSSTVVEAHGFEVLTASTPTDAILAVAAAGEKIRFAILDYNMPLMNGCGLAKHLRAINPAIKIILHSGAIDIPPGEMSGIDAFVAKGDRLDAIIRTLRC